MYMYLDMEIIMIACSRDWNWIDCMFQSMLHGSRHSNAECSWIGLGACLMYMYYHDCMFGRSLH